MDVPPHPHIGLQTVSWLLAGEVLHNDSLGLSATARPGVLNLMTAGRGIAHSEKTPPENGGRLQGVQLWVALPDASRYTDPGFESHSELPELELEGGSAIVILGELGGKRSPGRTFSPIVGVDVSGNGKNPLRLPLERDFEHAFVPLAGSFELDAQKLSADTLYYLGSGRRELDLSTGGESSRGILIGGAPFREEVFMWWNFVGRTREEIAEAREDWEAGRRFGEVEAYRGARLEAPPFDERR